MTRKEAFLAKVDVNSQSGCWLWVGSDNGKGYGKFRDGQRVVFAHRWAYEKFVGLIPKGLELDHLCRNTKCVNPDHLEPVSHSENVLRGSSPETNRLRFSKITHCPQGHLYDDENTYLTPKGFRRCNTCRREGVRRHREKKRVAHA